MSADLEAMEKRIDILERRLVEFVEFRYKQEVRNALTDVRLDKLEDDTEVIREPEQGTA